MHKQLRTRQYHTGSPSLTAARYREAAPARLPDQPDLRPYTHEPARIDLNAKNGPLAYGAERSNRMDFSEFDRIDDFALNEILWRAVRGTDAPLPPAVRRAIAYRPAGR